MRAGRLVPVLVTVALVSACGGNDRPDDSAVEPLSTVPIVADLDALAAPPTTIAPSTAAPPTATTPFRTTPPRATEPVTVPPESMQPSADEVVMFGAPDPALLPDALPPTDVDWTEVAAGWLLVDHGPANQDRPALDQRGLYLVAPDGVVYGVSALPSDGTRLSDISSDRRFALVELYDRACSEGCTCPDDRALQSEGYRFGVLDLVTSEMRPVVDPIVRSVCDTGRFRRNAEFTLDGTGIWVSEVWFTDDYRHEQRVRLSSVEISTGEWTTMLDETPLVDETLPPSTAGIGLVELPDGRIAVSTRSGSWLRDADGSPVLELDMPHANCDLQRVWDAGLLVARCPASASDIPIRPDVPVEQCHSSGLWLIPVDGTSSRVLAVPLDLDGYVSCWGGYALAEPIGDHLAIGVGGDGCSDDVVLIAPDGTVVKWLPFAESCTELLLGVRNGAWLLSADAELVAESGLFEVTPESTTRLDLPPGGITVL